MHTVDSRFSVSRDLCVFLKGNAPILSHPALAEISSDQGDRVSPAQANISYRCDKACQLKPRFPIKATSISCQIKPRFQIKATSTSFLGVSIWPTYHVFINPSMEKLVVFGQGGQREPKTADFYIKQNNPNDKTP